MKDHCGNKCALMYGLFITVSCNIFCTFMTSMPNVIATLRAVEPVHRSLALGVESIVFRCGRKSKSQSLLQLIKNISRSTRGGDYLR